MITENYIREKLSQAAHVLDADTGPLHQRLFSASLATSTLQPRDFPDAEGRAAFGAIREMLTRHEPRGSEGRVNATLARMSKDEAWALAERILELHARDRSSRRGSIDQSEGEV